MHQDFEGLRLLQLLPLARLLVLKLLAIIETVSPHPACDSRWNGGSRRERLIAKPARHALSHADAISHHRIGELAKWPRKHPAMGLLATSLALGGAAC